MGTISQDATETVQLLELARSRDEQAFEKLFARHRAYLRRFVDSRLDAALRRRVDPSDVVQETLAAAFPRLDDYLDRQPMPFRLWLRKTAYERLVNLRQKHLGAARRAVGREAPLPDRSSAELAKTLVAKGLSPSEHAVRKERERAVGAALAKLREPDREILLMRTTEGLSYEEIGCVLDIEPATARKRYGRALVRIQKLLLDSGVGGSQT